jgi:hypothetical protein
MKYSLPSELQPSEQTLHLLRQIARIYTNNTHSKAGSCVIMKVGMA